MLTSIYLTIMLH